MVLHKLVNSTNVVFHMLDLQPYAMVLPMDKASSHNNKKKILSKVFKNNLHLYSEYGDHKHNLNGTHLSIAKTNGFINGPTGAVLRDKASLSGESGFKEESSQSFDQSRNLPQSTQENGNLKTEESHKNLEETNMNGQLEKSDQFKENEVEKEEEEDKFSGVKRFIDRIDTDNIIGCLIILAQRGSNKSAISPVAGGIVEVFDDYERSIQTLWLNNNITKYVTFTNLKGKKNSKKLISNLNDEILSKVVLSTLLLRLCAHAYQMTLPNSKRIQHKSRLISIYHQMGQTFPHFAYEFIKEEMQFSKHYEIASLSIKHNDNPRVPCKCLKPTPLDQKDTTDLSLWNQNNPLFFGITESRFSGMYNTTYEHILMGFMNLLSGKVTDVSKLMTFEGAKGYQEEDEYNAKRQKVSYRSRRLQNRL